jgi:hypothetical protein
MNRAQGDKKIEAIAALLNELISERKVMHNLAGMGCLRVSRLDGGAVGKCHAVAAPDRGAPAINLDVTKKSMT